MKRSVSRTSASGGEAPAGKRFAHLSFGRALSRISAIRVIGDRAITPQLSLFAAHTFTERSSVREFCSAQQLFRLREYFLDDFGGALLLVHKPRDLTAEKRSVLCVAVNGGAAQCAAPSIATLSAVASGEYSSFIKLREKVFLI